MSEDIVCVESTPKPSISKKRELTSPEFDAEYKKNRLLSGSSESSESDLNISSVADTYKSEISVMAAESDLNSTAMLTDANSSQETSQETSASHIMIPPAEMAKIAEMLKSTFRGEIVAIVDSVVQGVLKGLQDQITCLQ